MSVYVVTVYTMSVCRPNALVATRQILALFIQYFTVYFFTVLKQVGELSVKDNIYTLICLLLYYDLNGLRPKLILHEFAQKNYELIKVL